MVYCYNIVEQTDSTFIRIDPRKNEKVAAYQRSASHSTTSAVTKKNYSPET